VRRRLCLPGNDNELRICNALRRSILKRKLLIGILVILGIAVTVLNLLITGIFAVAVWIYLVRMVRKQKNGVFNDQIEQEITRQHLRRVKAFLLVAGISFLVFVLGTIVHNVLHSLSEAEETVSFYIALLAFSVFIIATAGGMVIFLKARQKRTQAGHNTV
jgi:hypothetical protein